MRCNLFVAIFTTIMSIVGVYSQDMQFTQFYAAPLYLNPALSGATPCWRVTANYRNQWFLGQRSYPAYMAALDKNIRTSNLGLGGYILYDQRGPGNYTSFDFAIPISYQLQLSDVQYLRFGLQPGYQLKYFLNQNVTFGDQYTNRDGLISGTSDAIQSVGSLQFFDLAGGLFYYTEKLFLGLALHHVLRNRLLIARADNPVGMKTTLHGGYKTPINSSESTYLMLAFNIRNQANFYQSDLGIYIDRSSIFFGFWYRGLPVLRRGPAINNDMVAFLIGWQYNGLRVGYSYDLPISAQISTFGSHELSLNYEFCVNKKNKPPRYIQQLPCPVF